MDAQALLERLGAEEAKIQTIRADVRWLRLDTGAAMHTTWRWAWDRGKELQYSLSLYEEGMVPVTHCVETGRKHRPFKEQVREEFQPASRYESTLAYNGTEYRQCDRVWQAQLGERCGGRISQGQPVQMSSYWQPRGLLGWVFANPPGPFLSTALAMAEEVRVDPNVKRLYGRPCRWVRARGVKPEFIGSNGEPAVEKSDVDLVLDAERSLRPLRIRIFRSDCRVFGKPYTEISRIELKEVRGIWMPVRGDFDSRQNWGLFSVSSRTSRMRIELNLETLKVNEPIDAGTFEVEFPPECVVHTEQPGQRPAPACGGVSYCEPKVRRGPWPGKKEQA